MLELGDAELELVELVARDEADVSEETGEPGARALTEPPDIAAPAGRHVLDRPARLVAPHPAAVGEGVDESLRAVAGQRGRTDGGEGEPFCETPVGVAHRARPWGRARRRWRRRSRFSSFVALRSAGVSGASSGTGSSAAAAVAASTSGPASSLETAPSRRFA